MPVTQLENQPLTLPIPEVVNRDPLSPWRIGLLGLILVLLYYRIFGQLVFDWWRNPNYSHGFLVPLFSLFVVWQQRKALAEIAIKPSWYGLPIIIAALCVLTVGVLGAELFLSRSSFIFLLGGLIIYFFGWAHFRKLLFPWMFLFLMIPIPVIVFNQIAFPLQLFASKVASDVLPLMGVPVLREGNVIQLPAISLEVAEACSGIRSLMSLTTLAVIYGYLIETSAVGRVLLVVGAVPIAVAANAIRIIGTGLLVQYWDPNKALGFFHEFSGWVIFVVALSLLFVVHRVILLLFNIHRGKG